jgi:hypothetical protein
MAFAMQSAYFLVNFVSKTLSFFESSFDRSSLLGRSLPPPHAVRDKAATMATAVSDFFM